MGPAAVHRKSRRIQSGLRKEIRTDQSGDPGQPIPLSQIGATPSMTGGGRPGDHECGGGRLAPDPMTRP